MPITNDSIVMLGDSITQNCEWSEFYPNKRLLNRGLGYDTALKMKARISSNINGKPQKVVLMVGINDLGFGRSPLEIQQDYRDIVRQILKLVSPDNLLLVSVLPTKSSKAPDIAIRDVNMRIRKISEEYKCKYLDLYSKFSTSGTMNNEYYIEDKVHLSALGYKTWVHEMKYFLD